jgi:hypothetical protein
MSDTPRTEIYVLNPLPEVVSAEFARELERELATITAERDRYKIALRVIAIWADNTQPRRPDIGARARKALSGEVQGE